MEDHQWKTQAESTTSLSNQSTNPSPSDSESIADISGLDTRRILLAVVLIAVSLSVLSFVYFFSNDMTNVYGDGVAHVNIARKVVDSPDDSVWQRYIQIGSPWLPVQTVLMLPLVTNDWLWRTGTAGSIVSMLCFVIAGLCAYLLARDLYRNEGANWREAFALLAAAVFVVNPSVLYMQATPMAELVFMAALVTSVYLLQRWVNQQTRRRLAAAGIAMTMATLTRYEAWPVAVLSVLVVLATSRGKWPLRIQPVAVFSSLAAIGPAYWLWHNWAIYGNALEFLSGPNSARGIFLQNQTSLGWSSMFFGHPVLAVLAMAATAAVCAGPVVLLLSFAGALIFIISRRQRLIEHLPVILLFLPFFFQVFSLFRGEIQVFPVNAFGLLNIRYGLPHVLAIALFVPAAIMAFRGSRRRLAFAALSVAVVAQYVYLVSEGPSQLAIYQEGYRNGVNSKPARERARAASLLIASPPRRLILMHTGALGPLVSQGGLRFADLIHEGSIRWHTLDDGIPTDVKSVILQDGDPLDLRIRDTPALARDLSNEFEPDVSVGKIKVFERRK